MKPQTTDNINFNLTGCTVKFLGMDDILESTDFMRELCETGEEGGFNTTWKPGGWRGTSWHLVNNDFTAWAGKTYRDYLDFAKYDSQMTHEIARVIQ
jgi:hypothetical protein